MFGAMQSCRARELLKNEPTLAIVAVHTDENEPSRVQVKNIKNYLYSLFNTKRQCFHAGGNARTSALAESASR